MEGTSTDTLANAADLDRRRWLVEIAAVVVVFVLPALALSIASFASGTTSDTTQATLSFVSGLTHSLSLLGFFAFLVWSSRESVGSFGLRKPRWVDVPLAIWLLIGFYALYYGYAVLVYNLAPGLYPDPQSSFEFSRPFTSIDRVIAAGHAIANGSAEEVLLWGVLHTRFVRLWQRSTLGVFVIAGVFASYHIYQGPFAVGGVFLLGVVHGSLFAIRPSLAPLILAHIVWDMQIAFR